MAPRPTPTLALLLAAAVLASGCLAGPRDEDEAGTRTSQPGGPPPSERIEPPGEAWYLDFAATNDACLQPQGVLAGHAPGARACWHVPGAAQGTRTFDGQARQAWPQGTPFEGLLVVYGQAPATTEFTVRVTADGKLVAQHAVPATALIPFEEMRVAFNGTTAAAIAEDAAMQVTLLYGPAATADLLAVGESHLRVAPPGA